MVRILSGLFWFSGLLLVGFGLRQGRGALCIPGAVAAVLLVFLADLWFHRSLVVLDRDLLRTGLHLAAAAALASGSIYWAVGLLPSG
ncbi:MAG: hypothetical protein HY900_14190 [Deltaproteobacteria bacterium]|nr:hypothetical protein [Deltaproteobacteria bacterium]